MAKRKRTDFQVDPLGNAATPEDWAKKRAKEKRAANKKQELPAGDVRPFGIFPLAKTWTQRFYTSNIKVLTVIVAATFLIFWAALSVFGVPQVLLRAAGNSDQAKLLEYSGNSALGHYQEIQKLAQARGQIPPIEMLESAERDFAAAEALRVQTFWARCNRILSFSIILFATLIGAQYLIGRFHNDPYAIGGSRRNP